MPSLRRALWAAALSGFAVGAASAQTSTTGVTTTGVGGTTTTTTATPTTTGTTGGTTGIGGQSGGQGGTQNMPPQSLEAPTISAPSTFNMTSSLNASNSLGRYYANPYYQGRAGATTGGATGSTTNNPGGFGTVLYSGAAGGGVATGGRAANGGTGATSGFGGTSGTAGTTQARAGSTSGFGGTTGATGGFGGATTGAAGGRQGQQGGIGTAGQNQQNNGLSTGRQISYTQALKFAAPPMAAPQMQSELRTMIDASASIADARGVSVTTEAGGIVTLQGTAKDEDEARLIEGMIRLTPGVRDVKNGLKYPKL